MSSYPPIAAGQRITAGLLAAMIPQVIVKTVATDRASTIVPAIDPDLQANLEANSVYLVEFTCYFAATNAVDVKTEWAVPTNAAGLKSVIGPASTATTEANADGVSVRLGTHQFDTDMVYAGVRNDNTLAFRVREEGVVTTTNSGVVGISWAQGTSSATAATLFAASYMTVRKIG